MPLPYCHWYITFSFTKSMECYLPASPPLCQAPTSAARTCSSLVWGGSEAPRHLCLFAPPRSCPTITDECVGISIPAPTPLEQNDLEVCFIPWLPEFSRTKLQEPILVTWLMMHSLLTSYPSCLPSLKLLPELTSPINYVCVNPCLVVCSSKN